MANFSVRDPLERIAIACMHLAVGRATLNFATSTQAAPSRVVLVSLGFGGSLNSRFDRYFPMEIDTFIWHHAVVPVLEAETSLPLVSRLVPVGEGAPTLKVEIVKNPVVRHMYDDKDWGNLIDHYIGVLKLSYQTSGYLPFEEQLESGESLAVPDEEAPGEPLNRPALSQPLTYQKFD